MLASDLREIKAVLEIPTGDTSEDRKLMFFLEQCSNWFEEILNRDFSYKTRTQYYNGTGTQKLLLKNRPVYPSPPAPYLPISVQYDQFGFFGQSATAFNDSTTIPLVYGQDYTLWIDQDDGSSRSGILINCVDYWQKPSVRQVGLLSPFLGPDTGSYKIVYTAGHTVDTLPASFRMAMNMLIARMRYIMPLGIEFSGEGYEERAISFVTSEKTKLLALVMPLILPYRNWFF